MLKLISSLALVIILVSCSENNKPIDNIKSKQNKGQSTETIVSSDGKVSVNLAFKGNEKYELIVSTDEKLTQEAQGQKQSISQSNAITYDMDIKISENGIYTALIKFNRIQKSVDAGPQGKESFDTKQKADIKNLPPNLKIFMDIIGKSYELDFNNLGRVKGSRGADKMISDIMKKINEKDEIKKLIEQALKQEFGSDKLSDFFEKLTNFTDSTHHAVGDKWVRNYGIESGINLLVSTTYRIDEIKDRVIKITLSSKLHDKDKNRSQTVEGIVLNANISGEQNGYILIDASTGFINLSEVTQKIYVNETRTKKDDPKQSMTLKTTKEAKFRIQANKR